MNHKRPSSATGITGSLRKQLFWPILTFLLVYGAGVGGYRVIMQATGTPKSVGECFYQVGILLTGVGFTDLLESHNSLLGSLFTVGLSLFGVGFLLYTISTVTAFIVSGELSQMLGRERMRKRIDALHDHTIICGCGETG
ncbi:MAG: potassium channel family protein, partial [Planctomycetota bacterium]